MKEKQEIRRIEIGIIQLVVVVFAAMVASKIPYTEITQGSIVLLGVVHVVSYYIGIGLLILGILSSNVVGEKSVGINALACFKMSLVNDK